jgi:NADH-quinone oxidoreductase subunit G
VLRVLGNLLALEGFSYGDSESVRDEALGADVAARLGNGLEGIVVNAAGPGCTALERVADVPIYFADPLVRRAASLQKAKDAAPPVARMSPATLARLGVSAGDRVRVAQGSGCAELVAQVDEGLADGCARVAAAHPTTAGLGAMSGDLSVERV